MKLPLANFSYSSYADTMPRKQKKIHPAKHTHTRNERGTLFFITRYFLFFSVALLFFAGTTYFLAPKKGAPCANSQTCTSDLSVHIDTNLVGTFNGQKVMAPKISTIEQIAYEPVLGASTTNTGTKHIYIDLSSQTLYAYQGKTLFMKTLISSGKWNPTPTGNFHIWEKLIATRMAGGEGADAYDLPNVPYVMYFYDDYGLHGAYWHDNFGHMMSHGCVNMRIVDAKTLYSWADGPSGNTPGTEVSVCDQITGNNQCIQNNPVD